MYSLYTKRDGVVCSSSSNTLCLVHGNAYTSSDLDSTHGKTKYSYVKSTIAVHREWEVRILYGLCILNTVVESYTNIYATGLELEDSSPVFETHESYIL